MPAKAVRGTSKTESAGTWSPPSLKGRIALVAGATRGAGRGISVALGEAGATVHCTGRSVRRRPSGSRPETVDETAELVSARGGKGIAIRVDHTAPAEVRSLMETIDPEAGRLDVLVNDVWGGDELVAWGKTFWEHSLEDGLRLLARAIHSHIITSHCGAPLLMKPKRGVLVEITDGDEEANREYRGNLYYDVVKTTVSRMTLGMAEELRPRGVAAVVVPPGFLRSEAMLDHFGVREENWRDAVRKDPYFAGSETPHYVGWTVASLVADLEGLRESGRVLTSWGLGKRYGFTDADGTRPDWDSFFRRMKGARKP